jgi:hypothetical protein
MNQVLTLQTILIVDEQGQTAICNNSKDWLLHHMDKETEDNWWK